MVNEMAAFVRVIELGGFSAASRDLGLTPSALSKLVSRLEARLGVRLVNRSTRALKLTAEGEIYFARSQRILADMREAEAEVVRTRERPRGLLRMSVGTAFGLHQLAKTVPLFLDRYPEIRLELTVTDRMVDLFKESTDLALRAGQLSDSNLVARKICDLQRVICAAPTYLARYGIPRLPDELKQHNCIVINTSAKLAQWPFRTAKGQCTIPVSGSASADNAEAVLQLGLAGTGIIRLGDNIVGEELKRGSLVPILTDTHMVEPLPVHAIYPRGRHRSPKVGAMLDFLVEQFASTPWRRAMAR
jgi:DNA-binding transcriptional LysR family regulator